MCKVQCHTKSQSVQYISVSASNPQYSISGVAPGAHLSVGRVDGVNPRNRFHMFGGSAEECCLDQRGCLPVVGISRLIFLISSQCSPRLTWIEIGDELMRVLFASFPVGVLVLVPIGCLGVIPGKVQIKTLMNIRCKVALQTEMDTTT